MVGCKRVLIDVKWWGLGAMISGAAGHLVDGVPVGEIVLSNRHSSDVFGRYFKPLPVLEGPVDTVRDRNVKWLQVNTRVPPRKLKLLRAGAREYLRPVGSWHHHIAVPHDCLGVHFRGTDKYSEVRQIDHFDLIKLVRREAAVRGLKSVFFCTDDDRFPIPSDWMYYRYHFRNSTGLHHESDGWQRHMDEAFIQLLSLAYCSHLLIGRSCFSEAALILGNSSYAYFN